MFDELFDLCKLYPAARFLRSMNMFGYQGLWKRDYEAEEYIRIVLLQREKRLTNRRTELFAAIEEMDEQQKEHNSWLFNELYDIDEKLAQVRYLYCEHELKIRQLWLTVKNDVYKRKVIMARKSQYSFLTGSGDRPYVWVKAQNACAQSGGCCGRNCGCCEKALKFNISLSGFWKRKKVTPLYGHCTSECRCCIKYKGAYVPHPLFKTLEEKSETEKVS